MNYLEVEEIVRRALIEDIGSGDITTMLTIPSDSVSHARIVAKEMGVVAGLKVAAMAFAVVADSFDAGHMASVRKLQVKPNAPIRVSVKRMGNAVRVGSGEPTSSSPSFGCRDLVFIPEVVDGARVLPGETIANIDGPTAVILTGERVALNFLQRMSGIATLTAKYVSLVSHTNVKIIDTRKTTPGLRRIEKYSVCVGGGHNHRFGLSDGILIKDNHIAAAGGVTNAVTAAKNGAPHTLKIECEVTTLNQLDEAIAAGADAVLLDNMPLDLLGQAVELVAGRVITEASGGVNEQTVTAIAETGVDLISVGALTHSAPALDISLQFK